MTETKKVFICELHTNWSCGDEGGDCSVILGIYDDPEKANNAGLEHLHYNYHYDEENGIYWDDYYADEAWTIVRIFNLNEDTPLDSLNVCVKKDDGKWYAGEEVVYG